MGMAMDPRLQTRFNERAVCHNALQLASLGDPHLVYKRRGVSRIELARTCISGVSIYISGISPAWPIDMNEKSEWISSRPVRVDSCSAHRLYSISSHGNNCGDDA